MKKLILSLLVFIPIQLVAQQIRVRGEVEFEMSDKNIKAGEDYELETESKHDGVRIDIQKLKKNNYWLVKVSRSDAYWDSRLKVYIRRTNGGSGNGSVWGCNNYVEVRNIPQTAFQGNGILNNIYMQYKLTGISTEIPAGTYCTTIVYTLYEQ